MEKKFADIINEGKKNGKTYEEINAELKAAGANFHLDSEGAVSYWTEEEMAEGFRPGEEVQPVKKLHDYMKFDKAKAGTEETVTTATGKYRITWDEEGHPIKAVLVK